MSEERPEIVVTVNGAEMSIEVVGCGVTYTKRHVNRALLDAEKQAQMDAYRVRAAVAAWRSLKEATDAA